MAFLSLFFGISRPCRSSWHLCFLSMFNHSTVFVLPWKYTLFIILMYEKIIFRENVWFQKMSIPTPRRVIGNPKRGGACKTEKLWENMSMFKWKYKPKLEFPEGCVCVCGGGRGKGGGSPTMEGVLIFFKQYNDVQCLLIFCPTMMPTNFVKTYPLACDCLR